MIAFLTYVFKLLIVSACLIKTIRWATGIAIQTTRIVNRRILLAVVLHYLIFILAGIIAFKWADITEIVLTLDYTKVVLSCVVAVPVGYIVRTTMDDYRLQYECLLSRKQFVDYVEEFIILIVSLYVFLLTYIKATDILTR